MWQVVQNVYFAKSQEKPHKKLIFKHFGLSVPNLRKQNPARIRIRMTQKIILHGEPAFLKQSPLGWYTLGSHWLLRLMMGKLDPTCSILTSLWAWWIPDTLCIRSSWFFM